jgi:hypothetical protein
MAKLFLLMGCNFSKRLIMNVSDYLKENMYDIL